MVELIAKRQWTKQDITKSTEHPGRQRHTPASWICDLTDLKKTILLCGVCRVKFNPRKHGYRRLFVGDPTGKTDGYSANGRCDACSERTENIGGGTAFVHETLYHAVSQDPAVARRKARMRWRQGETI